MVLGKGFSLCLQTLLHSVTVPVSVPDNGFEGSGSFGSCMKKTVLKVSVSGSGSVAAPF